MIANFRQSLGGGSPKLHPLVARLVDAETLAKLDASRVDAAPAAADAAAG